MIWYNEHCRSTEQSCGDVGFLKSAEQLLPQHRGGGCASVVLFQRSVQDQGVHTLALQHRHSRRTRVVLLMLGWACSV